MPGPIERLSRTMRTRSLGLAALACWFGCTCLALAQAKGVPEVRVSARSYVLPPLEITAETNVVEVDTVVRHADGSLVGNLGEANFQLLDNGRPRALSAFSITRVAHPTSAPAPAPAPPAAHAAAPPPAAVPRSITIYFDDVDTDKNDLANARNAATRFVREAMAPGDRVAVYTASSSQGIEFTHDSAKLLAAIAQIRAHPRQSDSQLSCPRITPFQAYLIAVEHEPDALTAAIDEWKQCPGQAPTSDLTGLPLSLGEENNYEPVLAQAESTWDEAQGVSLDVLQALRGVVDNLARQPGSRMLLLASGGFLDGGPALANENDNIVQDALHAGVVINSLDAKGLYTDIPGRPIDEDPDMGVLPLPTYFFEETSKMPMRQAENDAMATLAESTGGLFFQNNNDLSVGFQRLGMLPEITYNLAFSPSDIVHDGKYHKLKIRLVSTAPADDHDILQYRPGYFAPGAEAVNLPQAMDNAMRSAAVLSDVPATVTVNPSASTAPAANLDIRLDVAHIPFTNTGGRRRQDMIFIAGLFNAQGRFVVGKRGEMDLALTDTTWRRLSAQGMSAKLSLPAQPGTYELRVVVGESTDGKLYAATQPVRIQ